MNDVDLRDDSDISDENDLKDTDNADTKRVDENTTSVDLYVANAGKAERNGGPYLDDVERHNAETWRAQRENREPDYDNPPTTAGTALVPKSQLLERDTDKSHFSDNVEVTNKPYATVEVQSTQSEPDPAQPDFDNDYDRLKAFEAKERLNKVDGDTNKRADSPEPVAEHDNTEASSNSAVNKPDESVTDTETEDFTGAEDADDVTITETNGDDSLAGSGELWESESDDTVNPGATGDGVNR